MVWFVCDGCGDSIKKPKVQSHIYQCSSSHSFTCVDCCQTFDRQSVKNHSTCVTEHEKYALGATKPGGFAANGVQGRANGATQPASAQPSEPTGLEFLSSRPPWNCSVCNVSCTSKETLMSHAAGVKHKRRARAALNAQQQQQQGSKDSAGGQPQQQPQQQQPQQEEAQKQQDPAPAQEPVAAAAPEEAQEDGPPSKKQKRDKKDKHKVDVAAAAAPPPATPPPPQQPAGGKGSKPTKAGKQQHPALADEEGFGRLLRVVGKRLKSKGKVGAKKLQALARKKLPALQAAAGGGAEEEEEGELDAQLLQALREKIVAAGVAKVEGNKLLPA